VAGTKWQQMGFAEQQFFPQADAQLMVARRQARRQAGAGIAGRGRRSLSCLAVAFCRRQRLRPSCRSASTGSGSVRPIDLYAEHINRPGRRCCSANCKLAAGTARLVGSRSPARTTRRCRAHMVGIDYVLLRQYG